MSEQDSGGGDGLITHPNNLAQRILEWQRKGYHVLSPAIRVMAFAPGMGVNVSLAVLDPRTEEEGGPGDVYWDKNQMDPDERAPSKLGLMKIASLAGVNWVDPYGRVDPLTIQNLWIYRVTGVYLAYDGTPQVIKGEKEIDYRDGSAQVEGWSAQRLRQARCGGAERSETGALERAIRTIGIKHTYKVTELANPFVVLRVSAVVDTSDPAVRAQLAARAGMSAASLYAGTHLRDSRALMPAPEVLEVIPQAGSRQHVLVTEEVRPKLDRRAAEPVQERRDTRMQEAFSEPAAQQPQAKEDAPYVDPRTEEAQPEAKMPDGAVRIRSVRKEQKPYSAKHQKAGQSFTLWHVEFEGDKQEYTTSYAAKWGKVIDDCYAAGKPVVYTAAGNNFGENEIVNIKLAEPVAQVPVGGYKL